MSDPKGFLKFRRESPERKPVDERLRDSKEFYLPISEGALRDQGARCMDCGVPFCQGPQGCPVENQIPEWNDLIHQGRWREALKSLHATNNFPEFTGRLCPAPCESACVLGINSDPVSIRLIEWKIIDHGFDQGWVTPIQPLRKSGKKVAIVGSGPAGLAAAQQLARAGHEVTVFEKEDRPGGLLRYGIPDFKMEKKVLDRRLEQMRLEGVMFKTGIQVGRDVTAAELDAQYEATCLTVGAEVPRDLPIPGRNLSGIHYAMDYLIQRNRTHAGDRLAAEISARGRNVVIIGGGDTGSDCLGSVLRQGAKSVHQFELQPEPPRARDASTPWPLWPIQLRTSHAHEEGGVRGWRLSTTQFVGDDSGKVTHLKARRVVTDSAGRLELSGEETSFDTDLVLLAMGFTGPARAGLLDSLNIKFGQRGLVSVDQSFMTSRPGVFAAGDASRGASLIVWAIAEGRKMATAVDSFLAKR